MFYSVISAAMLAYAIVLLLFGKKGYEKDNLLRRLDSIRDTGFSRPGKFGAVNEELRKPFRERMIPYFQKIIDRIGERLPRTNSPKLRDDLRRAGFRIKVEGYNALRLIICLILAIVGYLLARSLGVSGLYAVAIAIYVIIFVFIIMRFALKAAITSRRERMLRQMPEILDLLSVSVDAGLSFDASLANVSSRMTGPLVLEFRIMQQEISLGRPKRDALTNLSNRCMLEEVQSFSNAIIQSEQLGISLKNVLKSQSKLMRQQHRQRIEEKAMKAPVKIVFPLILFVLPVLIIILLGPSILSAMKALG